jgi:hypothetical protein
MGVEQGLKSSALPQLLALLVAACGGRYSSTGDSEGTGATSAAGAQGKSGASTGSGGASAAGGVAVGMGGTGFGVAGSFVGTAGTNAGVPISHLETCVAYCEAFSAACPTGPAGSCSKMCFAELEAASPECLGPRSQSYSCLTEAFAQAASCDAALDLASKLCGNQDRYPAACYAGGACQEGIVGDGSGCQATAICQNGSADLHCVETGDGPVCSCLVNGTPVFKLRSDAFNSKAACLDEGLRWLCKLQLL